VELVHALADPAQIPAQKWWQMLLRTEPAFFLFPRGAAESASANCAGWARDNRAGFQRNYCVSLAQFALHPTARLTGTPGLVPPSAYDISTIALAGLTRQLPFFFLCA